MSHNLQALGLIHEWEKPKDKDIILDSQDLIVLREVLATGHRIRSQKGVHTDYAKLHRILVTYWVYKKGSGVLDSHSIAITDSFEPTFRGSGGSSFDF
jgi:hypothetical protein